jgi:hypothetical protein
MLNKVQHQQQSLEVINSEALNKSLGGKSQVPQFGESSPEVTKSAHMMTSHSP